MYLLYLDDSGTVADRRQDHLVLGGVAVFERQVHWVSDTLEKLATAAHPKVPHELEFHASQMRSGKGKHWRGVPEEDRRRLMADVVDVLANSHETTCAFACAVHEASFPHEDAMEIAFENLCNRFDLLLKRKYATKEDPQRGLIIIDRSTYETSLQKLTHGYRSQGTRWGVLRNMCDVPFFVDSHASRLVQLADHVAYAVFRYYERNDDTYLKRILGKFDKEGEKLHGLVHKQKALPSCKCPACASRKSS